MKITISFQYTENVIPPRCRKARPVGLSGIVALTAEVTVA